MGNINEELPKQTLTMDDVHRAVDNFRRAKAKTNPMGPTLILPVSLIEKWVPLPDPETGLVPCGCGGEAQMGKLLYTGNDPDLMPDLMTEYYAYCQDCGITTDNGTDMERVENEWNRAMGWKGGAE